jgi:CheY-like chemotaxis protein
MQGILTVEILAPCRQFQRACIGSLQLPRPGKPRGIRPAAQKISEFSYDGRWYARCKALKPWKRETTNRLLADTEVAMKDSRTVLVVDDEASIRRNLSVGLFQRGYEVEGCESGLPALEKIEAAQRAGAPHNLVILDIRLPDIDGLHLLELIKNTYPDLPVVVISGYGDDQTVERVKAFRGSAYLDKPFELGDLEAEMERIAPPEPGEKAPRPEVRPGTVSAQSAYVFLRGKAGADLSGCFSTLYFADGVCYCDAVMGDWDIVLLVQAADRRGIRDFVARTVQPLAEIEKWEVHYSERPALGRDIESFIRNYERMQAAEGVGEAAGDRRTRQLLSAYTLLDLDKSLLSFVYPLIYFDENVVYFDTTDDCGMAVALVQGRTYDEIRRALSRLMSRRGVLRAKTLNIVKFQGL